MKRSQVTVFVIIGVTIILTLGMLFYIISNSQEGSYFQEIRNALSLSDTRTVVNTYVNLCIKHAVEESIQDTGMRLETIDQYKGLVMTKIKDCSNSLFEQLRTQKYIITEKEMTLTVDLEPETITVNIDYPFTVENGDQKTEFEYFFYTFDRSVSTKIPGGVTDKEIRIVAANGKAELVIPKGVSIINIDGKPVESIGIRVEDLHFDGLENKYNLGQLTYDNFPDQTFFSKPIELSIDFREQDIPPGYTKDNIKIAWWNNESGIWLAVDTKINNNRATAQIQHFTDYGLVLGVMSVEKHRIFEQRFYPYTSEKPGDDKDATWDVGGRWGDSQHPQDSITGIVTLSNPDAPPTFDFRDEYPNTQLMIAQPKIQYGYYLAPPDGKAITPTYLSGLDDSKDFVDCETTAVSKQITLSESPISFSFDGNYPYIDIKGCMPYKCSQENPECQGKTYCEAINDNLNLCIPYNSITNRLILTTSEQEEYHSNGIDLPCRLAPSSELEPSKVFGWHNYRCVGGRVRPNDATGSSDILLFQPNGNAILNAKVSVITNIPFSLTREYARKVKEIYNAPDIVILTLPAEYDKDYPITFEKNNQGTPGTGFNEMDPLAIKLGCDNTPCENTEPYDNTLSGEFKCILRAQGSEVNPEAASWSGESDSPIYKELDLNFIPGSVAQLIPSGQWQAPKASPVKYPAYGIYGVDIIKKNKKDSLQAYCDVAWYFWGNGNIDYYPNFKISEQVALGTLYN